MFGRIAVDCFEFAAVHGEVGLAIAVEIEFAQRDAADHGLLEDACRYDAIVPDDFTRQADAECEKSHRKDLFDAA